MDNTGGRIKVTPEVAYAEAQLRAVVSSLSEQLEQLRPQVIALKDTWQGKDASQHYFDLQGQWDWSANDLMGEEGLLAQIAHAMGVVSVNYYDCEMANAKAWAHGR